MFTGLIQEIGKVKKMKRLSHTIKMTCEASEELLADYEIGDSIAINGTCLTATEKTTKTFTVDIMPETFQRTTFATMKVGDEVNLELAMSLNQKFDGHIVSGHIDTTTRLVKKEPYENALLLTFEYPNQLLGEIISQGSIAIDGISLTVTNVKNRTFSVSIIPHSQENTTINNINVGKLVNIETDLIGKYIKAQSNLYDSSELKGGLLYE